MPKFDLMQYLPDVLRRSAAADADDEPFIERFLRVFAEELGELELLVDRIPNLFDPWKAEARFLPYLASWLALQLPEEFGERTKRALIANIVSIYRKRGTLEGLDKILRIYLGTAVKELKEHAETSHLFVVTVNFPQYATDELAKRTRAIRKVINTEKPAHADYEWNILTPTMQIGVHSTIGVDTILGTSPNPES